MVPPQDLGGLRALYETLSEAVRFPEPPARILTAINKLSLLFTKRRPTVVEERRKLLQKYLTGLAKINLVYTSPEFQDFL